MAKRPPVSLTPPRSLTGSRCTCLGSRDHWGDSRRLSILASTRVLWYFARSRAGRSDPLLAGVLLALAAWALVEIRAAEPAGDVSTLVVAEGSELGRP